MPCSARRTSDVELANLISLGVMSHGGTLPDAGNVLKLRRANPDEEIHRRALTSLRPVDVMLATEVFLATSSPARSESHHGRLRALFFGNRTNRGTTLRTGAIKLGRGLAQGVVYMLEQCGDNLTRENL